MAISITPAAHAILDETVEAVKANIENMLKDWPENHIFAKKYVFQVLMENMVAKLQHEINHQRN